MAEFSRRTGFQLAGAAGLGVALSAAGQAQAAAATPAFTTKIDFKNPEWNRDKIGFALGGTLLVGLLLSGFGFDAARAYAGLPQPESALTGVLLAFAIVPGLSSLVAGLIFARWGQAAPRAAR